jgi:hypothetical protein
MEFSHPDAVAQAVSIARSASGTQVDWTREPLTERERKIRQRWLLSTILRRLSVHTGGRFASFDARMKRWRFHRTTNGLQWMRVIKSGNPRFRFPKGAPSDA